MGPMLELPTQLLGFGGLGCGVWGCRLFRARSNCDGLGLRYEQHVAGSVGML